jgi:hypothetical protein
MTSSPRVAALAAAVTGSVLFAAELESRVLTHYVPQDALEAVVRTEGWTELPLKVKGGVRKGDTVRVWAGGSIDRGGERPGQNCAGPTGDPAAKPTGPAALSDDPAHAYCLLVKTEGGKVFKCAAPGKPLEIGLARDEEKVFLGFNDEKGRYLDNHLGRGRRHELDPLWLRVEVVRITVD